MRKIARHRGVDESQIIQRAVEKGLEELWRDIVITQYLEGELSREAAIDELGRETVRKVDTAAQYVEADVEWGLDA
ncbi:hypothetical protein C496_13596 [Natronorubrum tibetense GA33]|uniref:Ribbon-helix-helix protein CopG domain-containing protein n=1 Tax=Natronorubrum tibetense GA33 TaxID=1114856 RepID=L9VR75_9EURY|nr:hypothetical protein C496_13596 [Natronorubrum tibetense GA33]